MTTFRDLGLRAELVDALAAQGIDEPFAIQAATIADALAGRDVCGKAKTGSGKTLAFGLPMLQTVEAAQARPPHRARARADARARQASRRRACRRSARPSACASPRSTAARRWKADPQPAAQHRDRGRDAGPPDRPARARRARPRRRSRSSSIDEADRMADMGFLPQVEWILRKVPDDAPDAAVLRDARPRGRRARAPLHDGPGASTRSCPRRRPSTR